MWCILSLCLCLLESGFQASSRNHSSPCTLMSNSLLASSKVLPSSLEACLSPFAVILTCFVPGPCRYIPRGFRWRCQVACRKAGVQRSPRGRGESKLSANVIIIAILSGLSYYRTASICKPNWCFCGTKQMYSSRDNNNKGHDITVFYTWQQQHWRIVIMTAIARSMKGSTSYSARKQTPRQYIPWIYKVTKFYLGELGTCSTKSRV